ISFSMRFIAVFVLLSCFVASEAFFGEDAFKGTGDFFTSLMDKLKTLTGSLTPTEGNNSTLPEPVKPIVIGEPVPLPPAPVEKKND
ncbi:hypothetical protein PFISCL1PPCAC_28726, partial [Pristionchus fissidentatus]